MALYDCIVYGIVDRDYRSDNEIASLEEDKIFVLDVAEVENLFLVEGLVRFMAERLAVSDIEQTVGQVKDFVIKTKFANMVRRQICQSVVSEIKYHLSCIEISKKGETEAKSTLKTGLEAIKYDEIESEKEELFKGILSSNDYDEVLKVFNEKGIVAEIGKILGIDKRQYQEKVINLLRTASHDVMVDILRRYVPDLENEDIFT